jgi:hypothetical protein
VAVTIRKSKSGKVIELDLECWLVFKEIEKG